MKGKGDILGGFVRPYAAIRTRSTTRCFKPLRKPEVVLLIAKVGELRDAENL